MPQRLGVYHEPFIGGGALFFELYRRGFLSKAVISDLNTELIDAYIAIRDQVEEVINLLATYPHNADFFYGLRAENPWQLDLPRRAARMIYLNKTCYNGLYRVNRQGKFNVPFGRYKSPTYNDPENLRAVSKALGNVTILCVSFETVAERAQAGDWVYFDPPYAPLTATANFTSYQADGFDQAAQEKLRDVCLALTHRKVNVTLSNSATATIGALYQLPEFEVTAVVANRAINSNPDRRGKLSEYLVTNYMQTGNLNGTEHF